MAKPSDLSGQRFGKLTVIRRVENDKQGHSRWECQCDCGNSHIVSAVGLKSGHTKSCGCWKRTTYNPRIVDRTGKRYGRLTVIRFAGAKDNRSWWDCRCDCGNIITVPQQSLHGNTNSCGCLRKEVAGNKSRTHGLRYHPIWNSWHGMVDRCTNPNNAFWYRYGGRGITVCDEWLDIHKFLEWSVAHGYKQGLSIDRIDNDGNYCPDNCQWITMEDNASKDNYQRVLITVNNDTHTLVEWASIIGIPYHRFRRRWYRRGVDHTIQFIKDALKHDSIDASVNTN